MDTSTDYGSRIRGETVTVLTAGDRSLFISYEVTPLQRVNMYVKRHGRDTRFITSLTITSARALATALELALKKLGSAGAT